MGIFILHSIQALAVSHLKIKFIWLIPYREHCHNCLKKTMRKNLVVHRCLSWTLRCSLWRPRHLHPILYSLHLLVRATASCLQTKSLDVTLSSSLFLSLTSTNSANPTLLLLPKYLLNKPPLSIPALLSSWQVYPQQPSPGLLSKPLN